MQAQLGTAAELRVKRPVRARQDTIAAVNAAFIKVVYFRLVGLTFGVVAPAAVQRTTLEKNRSSDSRTIVQGETHDVEDETRGRRRELQGCIPQSGGFCRAAHLM